MESQRTSFGFPFRVDEAGRIAVNAGDDSIRGKIIQVLFTTPGERVDLPDFGCGLFNLVFEPNDTVLAAAVEFTIGQALTRWLNDEIVVDNVDVQSGSENVVIEVVYTKRSDLSRQALRVQLP